MPGALALHIRSCATRHHHGSSTHCERTNAFCSSRSTRQRSRDRARRSPRARHLPPRSHCPAGRSRRWHSAEAKLLPVHTHGRSTGRPFDASSGSPSGSRRSTPTGLPHRALGRGPVTIPRGQLAMLLPRQASTASRMAARTQTLSFKPIQTRSPRATARTVSCSSRL